ncbi:MAG: glycosyltransferase family 39 protein [Candidatus Eisenbacteria bacterium]
MSASVERTLAVLCGVLVCLHFSLAFRPQDALPSEPLNDDSFYALTIADNIARGDGMSIDGHLETNGFQPLIVLIYALVFRLSGGDLFLQIRLVHLVNAFLAMLSAALLYRFCARMMSSMNSGRVISLFAVLLWLGTVPTFIYKMNGLDTGLYFAAILACLLCYQNLRRCPRASVRRVIAFGALLGLTVLTRIDAVFLVATFCIMHIWHHRWKFHRAVRDAAIMGATAIGVSSPWWIYNIALFGSPMPTSGYAQGLHSGTLNCSVCGNLAALLPALNTLLYPFTYLPNRAFLSRYFPGGTLWYSLAVTVLVTAATLVLTVKRDRTRRVLQSILYADLMPLYGFGVLLFIFYTFFFCTSHFINRYLSPVLVATVPVNAVIITRVLSLLRIGRTRLAVVGIPVIGAMLTAGLFLFVTYRFADANNPFYTDQWRWVAENISDKHARIGAGQTGTLGYFRRSAVNLDGKVNFEALRALRSGTIGRYVMEKDIEYLIDWPKYLEMNILRYPEIEETFVEIDRRGDFGVFRRRELIGGEGGG